MGNDGGKDYKAQIGRWQYRQHGRGTFWQHATLASSRYKAPMAGIEEYIYELGTAKHTAPFIETIKKICNHIHTNLKAGATLWGL